MKIKLNRISKFLAFVTLISTVFIGVQSHAEMDPFQLKSIMSPDQDPSDVFEPPVSDGAAMRLSDPDPVDLGQVQNEDVNPAKPMEDSSSARNSYSVGPDDELRVIVYEEAALSKTYAVSGDGFISLPLIGDIYVEGLTLSEIDEKITTALSEGYLIDPSVSIEVSKYRPFYILGEVRNPGSYSFVNDMSVLNAVAMAGGFTYRADRKQVELLRTRNSQAEVVKEHPVREAVLPGDIILVKERFF